MNTHPLQRHILQTVTHHRQNMAVGYSKENRDYRLSFEEIYLSARQLASILCSRGVGTFALTSDKNEVPSIGILAAILSGKTFVPINPTWPTERITNLLEALNIDLIVSSRGDYQGRCVNPLEFDMNKKDSFQMIPPSDQGVLYIVPTSGTTASSKLIEITYDNVWAYLNNFFKIADIGFEDIIGHISELNFDVAIGDILWSFFSGAALVPIRSEQLLEVPTLIDKWKITVWSSAPSVAKNIITFYSQRAFSNLSLRKSFFIGEKLFKSVAQSWQILFPNGEIYNVYGPAEATISIAYSVFNRNLAEEIVPIGVFYENQDFLLYNSDTQSASEFEGELLLSGSQIMKGYVDANANQRSFIIIDGKRWYKTGDLVRQTENGYVFLRRIDNQIKIGGQRFELDEVESRLKDNYEGLFVHVIPYYFDELNNPTALVGITDRILSAEEVQLLKKKLRETIPTSFIPRDFVVISELPLNASGKLDRALLLEKVEKQLC